MTPVLHDGKPQIAFIGRSNVGKSTMINSLVGQKKLVKTSSTPGRTQQINLFLINRKYYIADLPGYGFVKKSQQLREQLFNLINWYLFEGQYQQHRIVLVIDAKVGLTEDDTEILDAFRHEQKSVIVVANKIDKVKQPNQAKHLNKIRLQVQPYTVIPFSSPKRIGTQELRTAIFETVDV